MLSRDDFRRLALALPETYEDQHRRRPAFRVNKRIFAMLGVAGNRSLFPGLSRDDIAVLKLDRDDQLAMIAGHGGAVSATETYGHHGWTYIRLTLVEADLLTTLMRLAWAHVAPRRLSRGG